MNPGSLAPVVAVVLGLVLFAGFWALITGVLASLSGWSALAAAFPGGAQPGGTVLRGQILGLGPIRENNVTNVVLTPQGMYLYPMILFRFRRPPVLVPWNRIRYSDTQQFLGMSWHRIDLGSVASARIRGKLLAALRDHGVGVPASALAS
jgi:hypothetical protein